MLYFSIARTCEVSDGHLDGAIAVDELEEESYSFVFSIHPCNPEHSKAGNSIFRLSVQSCY